jgi:hypothetical protein
MSAAGLPTWHAPTLQAEDLSHLIFDDRPIVARRERPDDEAIRGLVIERQPSRAIILAVAGAGEVDAVAADLTA